VACAAAGVCAIEDLFCQQFESCSRNAVDESPAFLPSIRLSLPEDFFPQLLQPYALAGPSRFPRGIENLHRHYEVISKVPGMPDEAGNQAAQATISYQYCYRQAVANAARREIFPCPSRSPFCTSAF